MSVIEQSLKDIQESLQTNVNMLEESVYINDSELIQALPSVLIWVEDLGISSEMATESRNTFTSTISIDLYVSAEISNDPLVTLGIMRTEIENTLASLAFTDNNVFEFIQIGSDGIESMDSTSKAFRVALKYELRYRY